MKIKKLFMVEPVLWEEEIKSLPKKASIKNGTTICIIGGGISGASFARMILFLAQKEKLKLNLIILDSITCNYCAGLMTSVSLRTFRSLLHLDFAPELTLSNIDTVGFINNQGTVEIPLRESLISMIRTDKFGVPGFDDNLKFRIPEGIKENHSNLEIITPAVVNEVVFPDKYTQRKAKIYYWKTGGYQTLEADIVVVTTGLQSLKKPLIGQVIKDYGYIPPETMDSSVTELDLSKASYNLLENKMIVVDEVIPDSLIGMISKGKEWLTISSLKRILTIKDLEKLFSHPLIKRYIDLPDAARSLKCGIICSAKVFTSPAKNFYGDGWVMVGDLTGYGRVLKDGYFACFYQAYLAAKTIIYYGDKKDSFKKHYHNLLKSQVFDNKIGMALFFLNEKLKRNPYFCKLFMQIANLEKRKNKGGFLTSACESLVTGELAYKTISFFYMMAFLKYFLLLPYYKIISLFKRTTSSHHPS